jgi:uncharacterized protein
MTSFLSGASCCLFAAALVACAASPVQRPVDGSSKGCTEQRPEPCIAACEHDDFGACVTWQAGELDDPEVAPRLQQGCDAGHAGSCAALGRKLRGGHGIAADPARANALFERACSLSDVGACVALATPAYEGTLTHEELQRVLGLYQTLCIAGSAPACSLSGVFYFGGKAGIPADPARGRKFFDQGCSAGDKLGCLLRDAPLGTGRDPRDPHSVEVLQALCDLSSGLACTILGGAYYDGDWVPRDRARAAQLFERGCDAASSLACVLVAGQYVDGNGVAKDEPRAMHYYGLACEQGQGGACFALGLAHIQAAYGMSEDHAAGAALLEKGCHLGNEDSCAAWAEMLRTGDGVPLDVDQAKTVLDDACRAGSADGCARRGAMAYEEGRVTDGLRLLHQACSLGLAKACDAVSKLETPASP